MSRSRIHTFPRTPLTHEGRFRLIDTWATERMGEPARGLGPVETRARLPKVMGLTYNAKATRSPAGGRIDPHLRHLKDVEALERLARAERFVRNTNVSPGAAGGKQEPAPRVTATPRPPATRG